MAPDDLERFAARLDPRPEDPPWREMAWPVPRDTELVGDHVRVATAEPADALELFSALDHESVWRHLVTRPDDSDHLAEILAAQQARPDWHVWIVRALEPIAGFQPGAVLGTSSYLEVSPTDARLEIGSTMYAPSLWGTAVNPAVKLLLLSYAFDTLGAGRVQLKTDIRNVRSQQAIARLGARYEGTLRRYQRRFDGSVRDTVLFSIIAEDWPGVRHRLRRRLG